MTTQATILITDHAWPDLDLEKSILGEAGFLVVAGPAKPASSEQIVELVREHRPASILTCWAPVGVNAIQASDRLVHVGRIGVGLDNIDVLACTARGIQVTNVPDYCVEEVSDHAIAFVLSWTRGIARFDRAVRAGTWEPAQAQLRRLSELTVGIVGYGQIGRATARKLGSFRCRILVNSSVKHASDHDSYASLDELLALSDIVILHVPLTPETRGMLNSESIAKMKHGALLVNVSRGAVVDTAAVVEALASGQLGGAALDVLDTEPDVPQTLLTSNDVLVTPHVAFSSDASLIELRRRAAEEAIRVVREAPPLHPCNRPTIGMRTK